MEKAPFSVEAPAVPGESSVGADGSVAGNEDGYGVGSAGGSYGPYRGWASDLGGQLSVALGGSGGDFAQGLPDPLLEGGSPDVEGQVSGLGGVVDLFDDGFGPLVEVIVTLGDGGFGEGLAEFFDELGFRVAEAHGADASGGAGDDDEAEGTVADGVADFDSFASSLILAGGHAQDFGGLFVEAAAGVEAGVVDGAGDGGAGAESGADPFGAMFNGVLARREAGDFAEDAQEMEAAHVGGPSEGFEFGRGVGGFDGSAGVLDDFGVAFGERGFVGAAAFTRAEAGLFGGGAGIVEADIAAEGEAGGAGGPAVDAGAFDGVDEAAVGGGVAGLDGGPEDVVGLNHEFILGLVGRGCTPGIAFELFQPQLIGTPAKLDCTHLEFMKERGLVFVGNWGGVQVGISMVEAGRLAWRAGDR